MDDDSELLLEVLNSTPVLDGVPIDLWAGRQAVAERLGRFEATGSARERVELRRVRGVLQDVVRGEQAPSELGAELAGVRQAAVLDADGTVRWELQVAADRRLAVRTVLAWAAIRERQPGRLRPCANGECHLFLLDRSKPNTARWCSMATCGNRLKARRHQARSVAARDANDGGPAVSGP